MELKTLILLTLSIMLPHLACTPSSEAPRSNANKSVCPAGSELNSTGTKCVELSNQKGSEPSESEKDLFGSVTDDDQLIPSYDTADLDGRFNRKKLAVLKVPEEFKEVSIIAKRTDYHRSIWFDVSDTDKNLFTSPKTSKVAKVSTHQPLQDYSIINSYDEPLEFFLGGHSFVHGIKYPCYGTMVMTPSPFLEDEQEYQTAILPPEDFEEIYTQIGRSSEDELNKCLDVFDEVQRGEKIFPDIDDQERCEVLFQGLEEVTFNSQDSSRNNAFNILFQKESVAIWRPKPQEGYRCLGDVTTNGDNNEPFSESDHAQAIDQLPVDLLNFRAATYCVKEEFAVRGKLDITSAVSDGNVTIFRIINDRENAPEGYAFGNYFYTRKGKMPSENELEKIVEDTKVWVINKEHVAFIEDDKRKDRDDECPVDTSRR